MSKMESPTPAVYFRMRLLLSPTLHAIMKEDGIYGSIALTPTWPETWCQKKIAIDLASKNNNCILTIINYFARSFQAWDMLPKKDCERPSKNNATQVRTMLDPSAFAALGGSWGGKDVALSV